MPPKFPALLRFSLSFMLIWCLFLCLPGLCLLQVAHGQVISDSKGFDWDFSSDASVEDGSNDTFDGGMYLYVGSDMFAGTGFPERDGELYVYGPEDVGGVSVTRSVLLIDEPAGVFYAETFRNTSTTKKQISPRIMSDFGDSETPQKIQNDDGKMVSMLYPHPDPRAAVVYSFGDPTSSYLPTLSGSGDVYNFNFPAMTLQAGQKKTIGYFVAQRKLSEADTLYKNEQTFFECVSIISSVGRFSFVNLPGMSLFDTGDLNLLPQMSTAWLKTIDGDEVYGDLETTGFELVTGIGTRKFTAGEVINLIGGEDKLFRIVASDGSILSGQLKPESLDFKLSDGNTGKINIAEIASLVTRDAGVIDKERNPGEWFKFSDPLIVFASGDRLTGKIGSKSFAASTTIGKIDVPIESLALIQFGQTGSGGMSTTFITRDGQRFSGILYDEIEVKIWDDSTINVAPGNLVAIHLTAQGAPRMTYRLESYLELGSRDFLFAKVLSEQQPLEFETAFGTRKIDPEQIATLENIRGIATEMKITLWDGSVIRGKLTSSTILFEILGNKVEIAVASISRFNNPVSMPPAEIRDKYLEIIKQLGSDKFYVRKEAIKVLEKDAAKIRGLLKVQLDTVDMETRAKIWKLLPEKDQRQLKDKAPTGTFKDDSQSEESDDEAKDSEQEEEDN